MIAITQQQQQTHPSMIGFHAPIELADVHRVQSLLVLPAPASSYPRNNACAPVFTNSSSLSSSHNHQQHGSRLAPIEMMAPSIHMVLKAGPPVIPKHSPHHLVASSAAATPSMTGALIDGPTLVPPLWVIPVGYILSAIWFSTCTLMAPGYLHVCGHTLCPLWGVVLLCHAAMFYVVFGDTTWACFGLLVLALFPSVVVASNSWVVSLYILVFAAFASGHFWKTLHGLAFIAVCVCWFALLSVFVLRAFVQEHMLVQMGLMGLFALAIAVIVSLFGMRKLSLRVSVLSV